MSYQEYTDLYLKTQKSLNAPFLCISLDLVDSKKLSNEKMYQQQVLMIKTMRDVVDKIKYIEQTTNRKILLQDKNIKINRNVIAQNHSVAYYSNPCVLSGDFYAFYVYNHSINENDFLKIFKQCATKNNLYYSYHFQSAKFETTEYEEGCSKYYLGYCVGHLQHNKGDKIVAILNNYEQSLK